AHDGRLKWAFKTDGQVASSPAVAGGMVYFGSSDDKLYALDASTGEVKWVFFTGGDAASSPAVADGVVLAGSYDGKLYAVDALSGVLLWSYQTGDWVISSPAIAENKVFVGSYDHAVYAFGSSTETPINGAATNEGNSVTPLAIAAVTLLIATFIVVICHKRKRKH
ncbi:MAG: PQQ-binding-like beta-propeller repeat protein, partial [Candidatus Bathyarchaeia archaeon]